MITPSARKPYASVGTVVLAASTAVCGVAVSRLLLSRKSSAGERLLSTLVDTEGLRAAASHLPGQPEEALSACAQYMIVSAQQAAEGLGALNGKDDTIGLALTKTHSYTRAHATVHTEASGTDRIYSYSVLLPDVGDVKGTRTTGPIRITGYSPGRSMKDVANITLSPDYTVQAEADITISDRLINSHPRIHGSIAVHDSLGNTGRVNISYGGEVTGTVTRNQRITGRFEGDASGGVRFQRYELTGDEVPAASPESGDSEPGL